MADKTPFTIGSGEGADLDLGGGEEGVDCEIKLLKGFGVSLTNKRPDSQLIVNGETVNYTELALGEDYAVKVGRHFLALRGGKNLDDWLGRLDHTKWFLQDSMTEAREGPMPALNLCRVAKDNGRHPRSPVRPAGMRAGFHLQDLWNEFGYDGAGRPLEDDFAFAEEIPATDEEGTVFIDPAAEVITPVILSEHEAIEEPPPLPVPPSPTETAEEAAPFAEAPPLSKPASSDETAIVAAEEIHVTWEDLKRDAPAPLADQGPLRCPVCWLRFDAGDILHIAVHDSLRGDPVLGATSQQRFLPTRFNDAGLALDDFGLPCPDLACPHCRRRLPTGFIDLPQHIVSIVGDEAAGKSYFLTALLSALPETLHRRFEIAFQDADPEANETINSRQRALASAASPAEARLKPTRPDSAAYAKISRHGRMVPLPRPFTYRVGSPKGAFDPFALTFFDNGGGDFLPGSDTPDTPGAQHVAHADGLIFLFDPFSNSGFRKRLNDESDPQFAAKPLDRQETLLSETLLRIQRHLHLTPDERRKTPLAVVVGKHDAWSRSFPLAELAPVVADGRLDQQAIDQNSDKLRDLLRESCPKIVGAAEAISDRVRYFAASSFGHTPVKVDDQHIAPDPARLKPAGVDLPLLWLLAQVEPDTGLS